MFGGEPSWNGPAMSATGEVPLYPEGLTVFTAASTWVCGGYESAQSNTHAERRSSFTTPRDSKSVYPQQTAKKEASKDKQKASLTNCIKQMSGAYSSGGIFCKGGKSS